MKHLYYGYGKGKTTSAIGMAIRATGANKKVLFVQFLKSDNSNERKILRSIDNIVLTQCPEKIKFTNKMNDKEFEECKKFNIQLFNKVTDKSYLENFDLIIFDEIFSIVDCNFIDEKLILNFITSIESKNKEYVFTAHSVNQDIFNCFDYITEMKKVKHPYDNGVLARCGIEY